mgnify:CR=1 FL=1|jgi:hypothetical protein
MIAQQNPAQADIAPKVPRMAKFLNGVPSKIGYPLYKCQNYPIMYVKVAVIPIRHILFIIALIF